MRNPFYLIAAALLAVHVAGASAQTTYGRVIDAGTGAGIGQASISLIASNGAAIATVLSDSAGSFRLPAAQPGRYQIRAQRIGYAVTTSPPIELGMRESVTVDLKMAAEGIPIEPLVVRVKGLERGRDGFERRSRLGKGIFLSRDSIEARNARATSNLFQGIKGLSVTDTMVATEFGTFLVPRIKSMVGWGCFAVFHNNQVDPISFSASRANTLPRVGVMRDSRSRVAFGGQEVMNVLLTPDDIHGVEIYRSFSDVPNELKRTLRGNAIWPEDQHGPCGIAIVWTRAAW